MLCGCTYPSDNTQLYFTLCTLQKEGRESLEGYKTVTQAAKELVNRSEESLRKGLRLGQIDGIKVVRDWLIPDAEVERLKKEDKHAGDRDVQAATAR